MIVGTSKQANAHQVLKVLWAGISIVLLFLVLYYTWHQDQIQNRQQLNYTAELIGDQVDGLINELMQSVHSMSINGHDFKNCNERLLPDLQALVFNNPQISGLVISDNHNKIICSTLTKSNNPIIKTIQPLTMYGPVKLKNNDKPVFIIQQRLGEYYLDMYLLKQVVESALKTHAPIAKRISLYDGNQHNTILQIKRDDKNSMWQTDNRTAFITSTALTKNTNPLLSSVQLANLNNFHIILEANPSNTAHLSWLQTILLGLLILSLSLFIYYYLRFLVNHHFSLHRAIRQAIKNNKFFPVYQPVFNVNSNSYCGAEVLLRWQFDDNEIIMPDFFITEAEQSGLIVPITLQLLEKTFQECRNLLDTNTLFHLAINLSVIHFTHASFLDSFMDLCKKYQISTQQLVLEVTERDLLTKNDALLIKKMNDLRLAGYSLAVDDFGTGYASIGYLQHLPFNYLKIDQLFIRAIGTGAITETLNQSIIQMAQNLKLHIIAEGVETYIQLEFLRAHGVNLMQGWYFANAMPIEQLITFIDKRGSLEGVNNE